MFHDAVFAGNDTDGSAFYIGRFNGAVAGIVPAHNAAYQIEGGVNIVNLTSYDVLSGRGIFWNSTHNGEIPEAAIVTGLDDLMNPIYIGRR